MAEGGGKNWIGIVVFIALIVGLNVASHLLDWNMTFY